jgi:hypothetical protein
MTLSVDGVPGRREAQHVDHARPDARLSRSSHLAVGVA